MRDDPGQHDGPFVQQRGWGFLSRPDRPQRDAAREPQSPPRRDPAPRHHPSHRDHDAIGRPPLEVRAIPRAVRTVIAVAVLALVGMTMLAGGTFRMTSTGTESAAPPIEAVVGRSGGVEQVRVVRIAGETATVVREGGERVTWMVDEPYVYGVLARHVGEDVMVGWEHTPAGGVRIVRVG